jgi:foldase protein PrsA
MRRTLALRSSVVGLTVVALFATSCGSTTSAAATVGDTKITDDSIQTELEEIKGNTEYRGALEQAYGTSLAGVSKGTFGSEFVAQVLSLRIYYQLLENDLKEQGKVVTADDRKEASDTVEQQFASLGEGVLKKFSAEERKRLTDQQALVTVASKSDPQEYYDQHPEQFTDACVSHILIDSRNQSAAKAKAKAEDVKAQLEKGGDFAALAKANSVDTGSADKGGDLGCTSLGVYVEAFAKAAYKAPLNQVTDPVKSDFGYHLIVVKSRTPKSYAEVKDQVASKASDAQSTVLDEFLVKATCKTKGNVKIDPKYGRWDTSECKKSGVGKVVPPKGSTAATTTTEQTSTSEQG